MSLFDVSKYEVPACQDIDMPATRKNFNTYIRAYKMSREKIGQPRVPKVTQSFSLVPPSTAGGQSGEAERILIQKEDDLEEFNHLHGLFVKGYVAISHPIKSEITERRRQIFILRFMQGFTVMEIMDLIPVSKDVITDESKEAMLQFCHALELTLYNFETKKAGDKSE